MAILRKYQKGNNVFPYNTAGPVNDMPTYYSEDIKNENLPLSSSPSYRAYTMGKTGGYDEVTKRLGVLYQGTPDGRLTIKSDPKTGYNYFLNPETGKEFEPLDYNDSSSPNIQRFLIDVNSGIEQTKDFYSKTDKEGKFIEGHKKPKGLNTDEETQQNIFRDLYTQNLAKYGDKERAYFKATETMKNVIEPQFKGSSYEMLSGSNTDRLAFNKNKDRSLSDIENLYEQEAGDIVIKALIKKYGSVGKARNKVSDKDLEKLISEEYKVRTKNLKETYKDYEDKKNLLKNAKFRQGGKIMKYQNGGSPYVYGFQLPYTTYECPEGYTYNEKLGACVANTKTYELQSSDKEEDRDYRNKNLAEYSYSELRNKKYLKDLPNISAHVFDPNVFEKNEDGSDYVNEEGKKENKLVAYFKMYPKPNYNLVVDPSKPEGYFDDKSRTLYTKDKNSLHAKKFNEWNKLIAIQEQNLKNAKDKNLIIDRSTTDGIKDWEKNQFYMDPKYMTNNQKPHGEYLQAQCADCDLGHGIEKYEEDESGNLIANYNTHRGYINRAATKNSGKIVTIAKPNVAAIKNEYRNENHLVFTPVEGTPYFIYRQDYRRGDKPYMYRDQKGIWRDVPGSKKLHYVNEKGEEITRPDPKYTFTQQQFDANVRSGAIKLDKPKVEVKKKGGKLMKYQKGKTLIINDPKEFAYRKKMYEDSLNLYNKSVIAKNIFETNILKKYNLPNTSLAVGVPYGKNKTKTTSYSRDDLNGTKSSKKIITIRDRNIDGTASIQPIRRVDINWAPESKEDAVLDAAHKYGYGYLFYKKPTQPVALKKQAPKVKKEEPKVKKEESVAKKEIIAPKNTRDSKTEAIKPKYPKGYQPYSIYGRQLDPEVYGYGESINNKPIEVAQFADTYDLKEKMEEYKKANSYPWLK